MGRSSGTLKLFFSPGQEGILSQKIYCHMGMAVLLASHILQAKFRHYNKEMDNYRYLSLEGLVPQ